MNEITQAFEMRRQKARADYDATLLLLQAELDAVQAACPHPGWNYHPDPSGNNDSWNECTRCGAAQ